MRQNETMIAKGFTQPTQRVERLKKAIYDAVPVLEVERAVLLRMGISSLETQKIVEGCMDHGLMGHGAGHVVYKLSKEKGISIPEAGHLLAQGKCWDEAAAYFTKGGLRNA